MFGCVFQQSLRNLPEILTFAEIPEMIYIKSWSEDVPLDMNRYDDEIIVDLSCGAAVVRGANVYAVGVIGYPHSKFINEHYFHLKKTFINS